MRGEGRILYRYSESFKQSVVEEIESGKSSISECRRKYGIKGAATVANWLRKMGKNQLLGKVVRVEKPEERDKIKKLEAEKRALEKALAKTQVEVLALESLVEVADEEYGLELKKKYGQKLQGGLWKKEP